MKLNKIFIPILPLLMSSSVLFAELTSSFSQGGGFGNPGIMGRGVLPAPSPQGGGNGGGGNGGGNGGGAQYKPNPLVQEILKKGEESAKEITKIGESATKALQESSQNSEKAIATILNQPNQNQEIIEKLVEKQKSQDEAREKSREASNNALAENKKSMNTLVNTIVDLKLKTLEASLPPRKEVDSMIKTPSNAELLSQSQTGRRGPSSFGSALSARDLASEQRANNTIPPSGNSTSSEAGHSGHNHGVKSSKIHNPPAEDRF